MEKILIVEDDEMVRCGIEDVLKMRDWNTETASTFAEGMEIQFYFYQHMTAKDTLLKALKPAVMIMS